MHHLRPQPLWAGEWCAYGFFTQQCLTLLGHFYVKSLVKVPAPPAGMFIYLLLFVCFDSLPLSHNFFSHVRMGLPGLNQYCTKQRIKCLVQSKKNSKDRNLIQSSTTPVPGYKMGK